MMDKYGEDFFLQTIQDYKISVVRITPPLAIFLAKTPKVYKYDLSSVSELFSAAAPLSGDIEEALKKRYVAIVIFVKLLYIDTSYRIINILKLN